VAGPDQPDPAATNPDAGLSFRAEMWLSNFIFGYWKHLAIVIGTGLLAVLVYGQWTSTYQGGQRRATNEIATVESELYEELVDTMEGRERQQAQRLGELVGVLLNFEIRDDWKPELVQTADRLGEIAAGSKGTARVEAWLKAAELYRLAGEDSKRRAALEEATRRAKGPLRYAAVGGLANLELEAGEGDRAVERLRQLVDELDGYLAEQSALDLALALEHLGRHSEARDTYSLFLERWPDSPRAEEAEMRLSRVSTAATAPQAPGDALDELGGFPDELTPPADESSGPEGVPAGVPDPLPGGAELVEPGESVDDPGLPPEEG